MIPVLSYGMGVESTAILLEWMENPASRNFDLKDLIVITSMVGDEYPDTQKLVEEHILPRMRQHNIRFVQVARAGHNQKDGIVVLSDTRQPHKLHFQGVYKLSDELRANGTVPQFGGEHRCALKFKAFVIETWLDENVYGPILHTFGYNADELGRVKRSRAAFDARNARIKDKAEVVFGFNSEEQGRADRAAKYDHPLRQGGFPLVDWGWNRARCHERIHEILGIWWRKSACVFCPFNRLSPAKIERMREFPDEVGQGLAIEYMSLCLNYRGTLYAKKSLMEVLMQAGATDVISRCLSTMEQTTWAVYHVRRVYSRKGSADRSVQTVAHGTKGEMLGHLFGMPGVTLETLRTITYGWVRRREPDVYPSAEEFYVAAPAYVQDKAGHHGFDWFDNQRWLPFLAGTLKHRIEAEVPEV